MSNVREEAAQFLEIIRQETEKGFAATLALPRAPLGKMASKYVVQIPDRPMVAIYGFHDPDAGRTWYRAVVTENRATEHALQLMNEDKEDSAEEILDLIVGQA